MLSQTEAGALQCEDAADRLVWRVGYAPEPWAWTAWQYADAGRFSGRWDDASGVWRTLYVGESPLACYLELLASFRPDPDLAAQLGDIDEDPQDAGEYPTSPSGVLPRSWCEPRRVGSARLSGWFAVPADKESLPTLRARFLPLAMHYRLPDVDAAAIRQAEPRAFTQTIASWLYGQSDPHGAPISGVRFESRHGDSPALWALFERPGDGDVSPHVAATGDDGINPDGEQLLEAIRIHRLRWAP